MLGGSFVVCVINISSVYRRTFFSFHEIEFKAMYTDSSSFSLLAMQLWSLFRKPHERLPSIWQSIPNTRMRWSSRTWPVLPMSSQALASSLQALWLCVDHFWDLSYYRLILLVHLDRSAWPTIRQHRERKIEMSGEKKKEIMVLNFTWINWPSFEKRERKTMLNAHIVTHRWNRVQVNTIRYLSTRVFWTNKKKPT